LLPRRPNQRHHDSALGAVLGSANGMLRESNPCMAVFMAR